MRGWKCAAEREMIKIYTRIADRGTGKG